MTSIANMANDEQKNRWLPKIMDDEECILATAWTEPMAGSDNVWPNQEPGAGIQTYAEKKGDRWVLNGSEALYLQWGSGQGLSNCSTHGQRVIPMMNSLTAFSGSLGRQGFRGNRSMGQTRPAVCSERHAGVSRRGGSGGRPNRGSGSGPARPGEFVHSDTGATSRRALRFWGLHSARMIFPCNTGTPESRAAFLYSVTSFSKSGLRGWR